MAGLQDSLREIHRLRKLARDLQAEINRIPIQLKARNNLVTKNEASLKDAQDALKKVKVGVLEKESSLKTSHQSIARYQSQLNDITDQKQFAALQHEIAGEKSKCQKLEDEILNGMTDAEERALQIPLLDQVLAKSKSDRSTFEVDIKKKQAEWAERLKATLVEIQGLETVLPEDFLKDYKRMVASYGADCLASVKGGVCQQCNTALTNQQAIELSQGNFAACKSCFRGLYLGAE